jgi:hypothetical protein
MIAILYMVRAPRIDIAVVLKNGALIKLVRGAA